MNWERLSEEEFEAAVEKSGRLCVVPLGCMEKHGQHMPVGTDSLKIQHVLNETAKLEDVVIFPVTMWLGDVCSYHSNTDETLKKRKMYGGIGISPELLYNTLRELCGEIHRNGFDKILLVNSHGGNLAFLDYFVRTMGYEKRDYAIMWCSGTAGRMDDVYKTVLARREEFPDLTEEDMETLKRYAENGTGGGHADMREVSQIMSLDESLIHADRFEAESGLSTHRMDPYDKLGLHTGFGWGVNYPNMYNGFPPVGCTKAIGDMMVKLIAERLAKIVKFLKSDETILRYAKKEIF